MKGGIPQHQAHLLGVLGQDGLDIRIERATGLARRVEKLDDRYFGIGGTHTWRMELHQRGAVGFRRFGSLLAFLVLVIEHRGREGPQDQYKRADNNADSLHGLLLFKRNNTTTMARNAANDISGIVRKPQTWSFTSLHGIS